jgi:hypothetical protein
LFYRYGLLDGMIWPLGLIFQKLDPLLTVWSGDFWGHSAHYFARIQRFFMPGRSAPVMVVSGF